MTVIEAAKMLSAHCLRYTESCEGCPFFVRELPCPCLIECESPREWQFWRLKEENK